METKCTTCGAVLDVTVSSRGENHGQIGIAVSDPSPALIVCHERNGMAADMAFNCDSFYRSVIADLEKAGLV
jgi:hypothetical protein